MTLRQALWNILAHHKFQFGKKTAERFEVALLECMYEEHTTTMHERDALQIKLDEEKAEHATTTEAMRLVHATGKQVAADKKAVEAERDGLTKLLEDAHKALEKLSQEKQELEQEIHGKDMDKMMEENEKQNEKIQEAVVTENPKDLTEGEKVLLNVP